MSLLSNMSTIPRSYLRQLAKKVKLTSYQTEAFVERMADMNRTDEVVCKTLGLDRTRYRSRMTPVYKKFRIQVGEKIPNKSRELFNKVLELYERDHANDSYARGKVEKAVDQIVKEVQEKLAPLVRERCGHMRILDMTSPIEMNAIFTEVKITNQILSKVDMDLSEVLTKVKAQDALGSRQQSLLSPDRVNGHDIIQQCRKILILGKPGAGKTTFLKYVGYLINHSQLVAHHVPAFVSLKAFQNAVNNTSLKEYIRDEFVRHGVSLEEFEMLFTRSRIVFLLDGLDEILEDNLFQVESKIEELIRISVNSRFIITCRLAASDSVFENFVEAEICDFTDEQISFFARQWFANRDELDNVEFFLEKIDKEKSIKELASNPLLLTLLCITFSNLGDFPTNRAELYREGVVVLLQKWDKSRRIQRSNTYKDLSRNRKEDLLSKIAYETFGIDEGLFKRKTADKIIQEYIRHLPKFIQSPTSVELDSHEILDSIIVQHGIIMEMTKHIYGFSHRTFHEYFVANMIASRTDPEVRRPYLQSLISNIGDHRWQEVFILTAEILSDADELILLFKAEVDRMALEFERIRQFLKWLKRKFYSVSGIYDGNVLDGKGLFFEVQDFYFSLSINHKVVNVSQKIEPLVLDKLLMHCLACAVDLHKDSKFVDNLLSREKVSLMKEKIGSRDAALLKTLGKLAESIPSSNLKDEIIGLFDEISERRLPVTSWWIANGTSWISRFRETMIICRDIGQEWNFDANELATLKKYYAANKLLNTCLQGDCYVNSETRKKISENSLLPVMGEEG